MASIKYSTVLNGLMSECSDGGLRFDSKVEPIAEFFHNDTNAEDIMVPAVAECYINGYAKEFGEAKKVFEFDNNLEDPFNAFVECIKEMVNNRKVDYETNKIVEAIELVSELGFNAADLIEAETQAEPKKPAKPKKPLTVDQMMKRAYFKHLRGGYADAARLALEAGLDKEAIKEAIAWVKTFLYENKSLKLSKPAEAALKAFQKNPKAKQTLFRGMIVPVSFIKFRGNQRPVASLTQARPSSWTTDKKIAEGFAEGGGDGVGVVLQHAIPKDKTFVDLNVVPFYKDTPFKAEKEVITEPGVYKTNVDQVILDDPDEVKKVDPTPDWVRTIF